MNLIPMFDLVIIKRDEAIGVSEGGIIIPDAAKSKMNTGTICAVGEGRLCPNLVGGYTDHESGAGQVMVGAHVEPLRVKVNDRVLFASYAGMDIQVNKELYTLLKEDEIIGIITEPTPEPINAG